MNLRYCYDHSNNTVTVRGELTGYLPAENTPHSWDTGTARPGETIVVAEKTFKQTQHAKIRAYVEALYATAADMRAKAKPRRPVCRKPTRHLRSGE